MSEIRAPRFIVKDGLTLVSTSVAVLVGLTSIYATTQAMRMTQASAQERVFDNQMNACLSLNATTARINANQGDLDAALDRFREARTDNSLRTVLEENDDRYADLHQEGLKLKMLMPDEAAADTVYDALDQHLIINNTAWEALEQSAISAEQRAAITAAEERQTTMLDRAGDTCAAHIAAIVRGEGRVF